MTRGTIFCDLDGTLIKHVPIPSENGDDIELIQGSIEKLKQLVLVVTKRNTKINFRV
jgi:histidinol phosphatase-like enzyme